MLVCSEIGNEMVPLELWIHGRNKHISQLVFCEHHPSFLSAKSTDHHYNKLYTIIHTYTRKHASYSTHLKVLTDIHFH